MTTTAAAAGQVSKPAAEIYDEFFVPALLGRWAAPLCEAAQIGPGQEVLDIACGTGATTSEAASRVGPEGRVVGLDRNRNSTFRIDPRLGADGCARMDPRQLYRR